jgi:hypothetical protein
MATKLDTSASLCANGSPASNGEPATLQRVSFLPGEPLSSISEIEGTRKGCTAIFVAAGDQAAAPVSTFSFRPVGKTTASIGTSAGSL